MSSAYATTSNRSFRLKLLLIMGLFFAPAILAYLAYQFWTPERFTNYGELIPPRAMQDDARAVSAGQAFRWASLRGKWVLVQIGSGPCAEKCLRGLYVMRQVRKAQGKDGARIERLWLVPEGAEAVPRDYEGTMVAWNAAGLVKQFPGPAAGDHLYLIDPRGQLMMRFPADPDPAGMVKDLKRLLKYSWVG
jgi:cytochrome oxidase Cu insertion factor (SCO1/SenC/PrrC family)